jgi:(p)ppGpp synthase/HD superfamily hydrolase
MTSKMWFTDGSLQSARDFAKLFHGQQKYGTEPYTVHLDEVEQILVDHGYDSDHSRKVAQLHDVVEDTQATLHDIEQRWGPDVAGDVNACTGEGTNRILRNASILAKLVVRPGAAKYKAADRVANLRRCLDEKNHRMAALYLNERYAFYQVVMPMLDQALAGTLDDTYERVSTMIREFKAAYDWSAQDAAIEKFAAKMKAKLRKKAPEHGHGWIDPGDVSVARLQRELLAHVHKGDPVDVGLLAMMIEHHDFKTFEAS